MAPPNGHTASGAQTWCQESKTRRKQSGHSPERHGKATITAPSPRRSSLSGLAPSLLLCCGSWDFKCDFTGWGIFIGYQHRQIYKEPAKMQHKQICYTPTPAPTL